MLTVAKVPSFSLCVETLVPIHKFDAKDSDMCHFSKLAKFILALLEWCGLT